MFRTVARYDIDKNNPAQQKTDITLNTDQIVRIDEMGTPDEKFNSVTHKEYHIRLVDGHIIKVPYRNATQWLLNQVANGRATNNSAI